MSSQSAEVPAMPHERQLARFGLRGPRNPMVVSSTALALRHCGQMRGTVPVGSDGVPLPAIAMVSSGPVERPGVKSHGWENRGGLSGNNAMPPNYPLLSAQMRELRGSALPPLREPTKILVFATSRPYCACVAATRILRRNGVESSVVGRYRERASSRSRPCRRTR